jgi:hypothetical protein
MNSNAPQSIRLQPSPIQRWLREPLLHFVVAGFALFVIFGACTSP